MSRFLLENDRIPAASGGAAESEEKLPFDPITVIKSTWRWRWWAAGWVLICAVMGAGCSWLFAPQYWVAETVIMYNPPAEDLIAGMYQPPTIVTQLNMVKVKDNLSETRVRLSLPSSLERIAKAVEIKNPKESELLHFKVSWPDADGGEGIARTLREVFLDHQRKLRRKDLSEVVRDVQLRLDTVRRKINASGDPAVIAKQEAKRAKERSLVQNRLESATGNLDVTTGEIRSIESQVATINERIRVEKERLEKDAEAAAKSGDLSNLNIKVTRLTERIQQHRQENVDKSTRERWLKKIEWNESALAQGLITKAKYDGDQEAYNNWRAKVEDDPLIAEMKKERDAIFALMTNRDPSSARTSSELRDLNTSLLRLQLNRTGLVEKCKDQQKRKAELERELFRFLDYEADQPVADPKLLLGWRKEEDQLSDALEGLRTIRDKQTPDFRIVSDVKRPTMPDHSYRKLFVVAICGFGAVLGVAGIGAYELLDTTVKSRSETELRFAQTVLGMLPDVENDSYVAPEGCEQRLLEPIRSVVRLARARVPQKGAKLLIVASGMGEGCTTVTEHLARCFGQQGENVLVVDGDVRQSTQDNSLRKTVVCSEPSDVKGLGEYLTGTCTRMADAVWPTTLFGVSAIPRSTFPIVPELLSSRRMCEMMQEVVEHHDVILVDGPPASNSADAEILASQVDGVILVVQARRFRANDVKKVVERLTATGTTLLGVVLNRVEPMFLESDWQ